MIKKSFLIFGVAILLIFSLYFFSSRVKFYVHHGIWLPGFCENFEFIEYPDQNSLFGRDGAQTKSNFEIDKSKLQELVDAIRPEKIWIKYSELEKTLKDSTLNYPCLLPREIIEKKINIMLWNGEAKGDYYNIWVKATDYGKLKITISMPFT